MSGFWEARIGGRTKQDPFEKDIVIGETRLHLDAEKAWDRATLETVVDLLADPVAESYDVRLEEGTGSVDLREANIMIQASDFLDIKAGRQILTWGTGDLIFLNDLFPKGWKAFFIGRDTEYLKAPSDAVKMSFFTELANMDIVYTPRFDSDRFLDGSRISFFNAKLGRRSGRDALIEIQPRDQWFDDDEIAVRLYRNVSGYELAAYAYHGFWKSPAGTDPLTGKSTFPPLSVYGASVRGVLFQGISHAEMAYYDSVDDRRGENSLIRNSELRILWGYEREIVANFTVGVQYYLELMLNHGAFLLSLPPGSPARDEARHVATLRLTWLLWNQNLNVSLFAFLSPSDEDAYLRPRIHYQMDDHWSGEIGGNLFTGRHVHTFFSQMAKNSNIYAGVQYGF